MKTVLVTGSSRGIGQACARLFAREGWRVAIHYHKNEEAARALLEELSKLTDCACFQADVAAPLQARQLAEAAAKRFGGIDALVNNAGIAQQKLFTEITDQDWHKMFSVNTDSVFYMCRAVLPRMIAQHAGVIVNVSSVWGVTGASCEAHYSASKAAVIGLTKALAKEVGPSGIRVNCVAPGVIDTRMNAGFGEETIKALKEETPLGRLGTPEEAAQLITYLCSDRASFLTGQVIGADGGFGV